MQLYDFQLQVNRQLWSAFNQHNSVLLQASTGTGKTVMGSHLCAMMCEHRKTEALVVAHRREIVDQTAEKLKAAGLHVGTIMAGRYPNPGAPVQVASIDTLMSQKRKGSSLPAAGFLWIDEAHRAGSKSYLNLAEHYRSRGAKIFGTTATPMRTDGYGLGRIFESMVCAPSAEWLIANGYLCPVQYAVGIVPDVSGVKLTAGDYNQAELQDVMDQQLLIGDIVDNWLRLASDRRTMVFAAGVKHSRHLREAFEAVGIRAAHIDGKTKADVRDRVRHDLESGEIQVICNAMVYVEGTDMPLIDCIVFAQPSKSLTKYLQQGGRGMRVAPRKKDLLVLDHAGVRFHHGPLEMTRPWKLTQGREQVELMKSAKKHEPVQFTCETCRHVFSKTSICPMCGDHIQFHGKAKDYLPADLVKLTEGQYEELMSPTIVSPAEKKDWYAQLVWIADERGRKRGWADHTFKEKFGHWPADKRVDPKPASPTVLSYVRSRFIAMKYREAKRSAAHV